MVYNFFDKKSASLARSETTWDKSVSAIANTSGDEVKSEIIPNQRPLDLLKQLHKIVVRKLEKRKVHSFSIDNVWGADLADMQLINKFNKGLHVYYELLIFIVNTHGLFL